MSKFDDGMIRRFSPVGSSGFGRRFSWQEHLGEKKKRKWYDYNEDDNDNNNDNNI